MSHRYVIQRPADDAYIADADIDKACLVLSSDGKISRTLGFRWTMDLNCAKLHETDSLSTKFNLTASKVEVTKVVVT